MKTWKVETAVVAFILLVVLLATHRLCSIELIAAAAVLLTFGHASVADRLAEREERRSVPEVECYRKMRYYFLGKEALWFLYFLLSHAYSALVGVCVFLVYPLWRRVYRRYFPLDRHG
jgi:hypothetical protein